MKLVKENKNIFGDNIAYTDEYDFSRANLNKESRLEAVTTVASICYQNKKAINSESLYNRLQGESGGLPSSSFEFVPVLVTSRMMKEGFPIPDRKNLHETYRIFCKFGEVVKDMSGEEAHLLNLRVLVERFGSEAVKDKFFNTEEECSIIAKHFKVFKHKVDLSTRSQMVRHRSSWQELSRRYVNNKKEPFQFYWSEEIKEVQLGKEGKYESLTTEDFETLAVDFYKQAIAQGLKPEEARRLLPQSMYTTLWSAWLPYQLENFLKLRLDKHSQWEIRQVAWARRDTTYVNSIL